MAVPEDPLALLRSRSYLQLLAVAALLGVLAQWTGKPTSDVLFSGQDQLGPLITHEIGRAHV